MIVAALNIVPHPVICTDTAGIVGAWNRAATRLLGWTADAVIGGPDPSLTAEQRTVGREREFSLYSGASVGYLWETRRTADGRTISVRATREITYDGSGRATGTVTLLESVDGKGCERAGPGERLLHTIIESTSDVIFVKDCSARYVLINRAGRELAGLAVDYVGRHDDELFAPELAAVFRDGDEAVLAGGDSYTAEHRVNESGEQRVYLLVKSPRRGPDGEMVGVIGTLHDITPLREAEEKLRRAERLASVGTLAAGIAHEINNPIGGILLSAQSASAELEAAQDVRFVQTCLQEVIDDAKRCGRIVQSVLRFARQQPTEKWSHDVNGVVRRVSHLTQEAVTRHGGQLTLDLATDLPEVLLNPTEFEQVLVNLIQNALQTGPDGVRIGIQTEWLDAGVRIRVHDDGRGMSPQELERIYDPFYTTRGQSGGTGLGLSVVHGIVEAHGGHIDVQSAPAHGTTFSIVLPLNAS